MSLLPTTGLAIDAASGLLLLFLGLYVLRLRPRQPLSNLLAAFSVSLGWLFFLINLVAPGDPLRQLLLVAGWAFALPASAALVLLVNRLVGPPPSRPGPARHVAARAAAAFAAMAGLALLAWFAAPQVQGSASPRSLLPLGWFTLVPAMAFIAVLAARIPRPRLPADARAPALAACVAAAAAGGHAPATVLALSSGANPDPAIAFGGLLYALLMGAFIYALVLAALRFGDESGPAAARQRDLAVAASVALFMYPGVNVGLAGLPWQNHAFLLAGFLLVPALWLRNTLHASPRSRATARNVALLALVLPVLGAALQRGFGWGGLAVDAGPLGLARVATVVALAYIILRRQLFDIDIKVKRAVAQGLVAAAFVGALVAGVQVSSALGDPTAAPVMGLAAMGLAGLALTPLQARAERLADALLPGVEDSPEYLNVRRLEVYRAALDQALDAEGRVASPRAGAQLAELRDQLGVTERDHAVLEHSLRMGRPGVAQGLKPGDLVLGKHRVVRLLGEGSFGRTWLAETGPGQLVVVKTLRPDRARDPSLLREARAMASIRHPRVVSLLGVEQDAAGGVLVMEHVDGGSLANRLRAGPLDPQEFLTVAADALEALGAVHAAGLLHRDVKPSNILLTRDGHAKLADFGVAHVPGSEATVGGGEGAPGTVRFMSPEQARGRKVTARSDLYSAAATLYEAHTGKPWLAPLPNETEVELRLRAASPRVARAEWEGPPQLGAWFAKALHHDPARRFADAGQMRAALLRALPPLPPPIP